MTIDSVKTAVLRRVQKKKEDELAEARQEAKRVHNTAQSRLKDLKKLLQKDLQVYEKKTSERSRFRADLENKKSILMLKKELIDSIFAEVTQRIAALDRAKRKAHLDALLKKAEQHVAVSKVYCSKTDAELVKQAEQQEMLGGLIAENKDGTERVDYRYEHLLQELRKNIEGEVTKRLFEK